MNSRSLRYFEAVARHGSFTRAAAELGVAQSALSTTVRKLEEELGVPLFVREARRVVPTPEARLLLPRAERIIEEFNHARLEIRAATELRIGEVRIGVPPMFGQIYVPPLLAAFHAAHPGVVVTVMEGSADEVRTMLDSGAIDLGVLENRRVPDGWERVEVGTDETVVCVRAGHPLAGRSSVTPRDLDGLPMAVFEQSFLQRRVLDALCRAAGASFRIVLQSNFVAVIHEAVAAGLGAATMLRSLAEADPRLVAIPFDPASAFTFSLCWRPGHPLTAANRALVRFATERHRGA